MRPRRRPSRGPSEAVKQRAYKAWGWHLRHAHELERFAPGAGDAHLQRMTHQLEEAQRAAQAAVRAAAAGPLPRLSSPTGKAR